MKIITVKNAQFFLLLIAIFWGSSYIWSKMLLGFLPPFSILFVCAAICLSATWIIFRKKLGNISRKVILFSALISLVSVVSNIFCMLALKRTSGSNTAFIVQLSIVITPIIMALFEKKKPTLKTVALALSALSGIYLITCAGKGFEINPGDIFAIFNALFFSLFIALQNRFSHIVTPIQFTFVQHATNTTVFLLLAIAFERGNVDFSIGLNPVFLLLIGLNTLVTIFTSLFQSSAIKYVRPEKATILYAFEPVITALLGTLLLGEKISGIPSVVGCVVILLTVVISTFNPSKLFIKRRVILHQLHSSRIWFD